LPLGNWGQVEKEFLNMANKRLGSYPSHGYKVVEQIDSAKQLERKDSGKTFFVDAGSGTLVINLPELSTDITGWQAEFVLRTLGDGVHILSYGKPQGGDATTDKLVYNEIGHTETHVTAADGIKFHIDASTIGVLIKIHTDGVSWYGKGFGVIANDIAAVNSD
tara:strand:+ start:531 stop:1019 length:489 start_codon:yes stop_codon:yes gene_type:complete